MIGLFSLRPRAIGLHHIRIKFPCQCSVDLRSTDRHKPSLSDNQSVAKQQSSEMDSSLFLAAREGNVEALRTLLQANPLLLEEATISTSRTPLHIASMLGHIDFVKELIKSKNNVNDYVNELDQNGFSAIHLACANGHRQVITELLVVNNELCNLKGKDGMTPLHCASIKGRVNVITHLLLASLVNVSETNVTKETALHLAVKNNQF